MSLVSRVLFPAPTTSYTVDSFPGELLLVPRSLNPQTAAPEDFIPLLFLRSHRARFLFLVLHGNSEDLGTCRSFCVGLREELNVHVLAPEYPGYGVCPGTSCDESDAEECTDAAFRFAREVLRWPASHIVVLGRSVGTGLAVSLAGGQPALGGLVLVSPFLSVKEACREVLGLAANFIRERFPSLERMPQIAAPCLVIHGQRDATIPVRHGQLLFEACRSRKQLVTPLELDHNANLLQNQEFLTDPLREFFGLPQRCQKDEELHVPVWVYSWRPLAPCRQQPPLASRAAVLLGQPTVAGKPDRCRCLQCAQATSCLALPAANGPSCYSSCAPRKPIELQRVAFQRRDPTYYAEATIAEAVEYILTSDAEENDWVHTEPRGAHDDGAFAEAGPRRAPSSEELPAAVILSGVQAA